MATLSIPGSIIEDIVSHAKGSYPREACGILAGKDGRVERLFRITNTDDSEATYNMDASEQFKALKEIKALGLEMTAIYHSHPHSPAYPSRTDINRAFFPGVGPGVGPDADEASYPGVAYVIVSLAGEKPETKAFLIEKERVIRLEIEAI